MKVHINWLDQEIAKKKWMYNVVPISSILQIYSIYLLPYQIVFPYLISLKKKN